MIHYFNDIQSERGSDRMQLPSKFTFPFHYTPHPLVRRAADEVNAYLQTRSDWRDELSRGKMFGVLLVQIPASNIGPDTSQESHQSVGFLAAFSGNLAGSNHHAYFVPPVFDLLRPGDFFKVEESNISAINLRIQEITSSAVFKQLKTDVMEFRTSAETKLKELRTEMKEAKKIRDEERAKINLKLNNISSNATNESEETNNRNNIQLNISTSTNIDSSITLNSKTADNISQTEVANLTSEKIEVYQKRLQELIKESQFQKAEFKRIERRLKEEVAEKEEELKQTENLLAQLKQERKTRSAALQMKLFEHFQLLNAKGETKDLCQIFQEVRQSIPPAGAGECALPKLLQYAYLHHLKPLAFGEFWWGESPKDEIRHHGQFYPSCKGKCEPILKHMLVGLSVDNNPLADDKHRNSALKIIYEDEWIVAIEKPAGMLSTPGKDDIDSVSERLQAMYPEATGPLLVHRLDMATSGILLVAKSKEVHAQLQTLFEARKVRKIYTAILERAEGANQPIENEGCINLPLCLNPMDRPRQMVSYEHGKEAITFYKVLATKENHLLVQFDLLTGRTHQIRVHAAHPLGLNCPIKGDDLYGKHADRLYLHATEVSLVHPVTGKELTLRSEIPFSL